MSLVLYSINGMPGLVNSDDLPSIDGNRCAARILDIAAAFERAGIEGVRVQSIPVDGGRFVISLNMLKNSLGADLLEFLSDHARKKKTIFSVEVALQIARAIQEYEASHDNS